MSERPKTAAQLRYIWAMARELRLDADLLHEVVEGLVGVSSLKQLTQRQAEKVISALKKQKDGATRQRRERKQRLGPKTIGITPRQAGYLKRLKESLGWTEDRLNGFVKRQTSVERWEWLKREQAVWVIQAMKEMAGRKEGRHELDHHHTDRRHQ
jgi:hypothetical protein